MTSRPHFGFCAQEDRWLGWSLALPQLLGNGSVSLGRGSSRAGRPFAAKALMLDKGAILRIEMDAYEKRHG